ncbi:MAG: energy-coupling factor transporter ATPase [Eubacteriaceae bacterium]|nr:energy-coupling factor transporter ATPase [Eubacteriaceae bacterium]
MSIEVKNLTYIYAEGLPHESKALEDISFTVDDGQFIGIIGHTGSGKSTLLQHLNGLLKPKSGNIIVGDTDITEEKISMIDVRKKIGLVFQYPEYQLFEETVEKDVAFGPGNLGLDDEEIKKRVKESLELTGLDYNELREKSPFELSGGQKRRVAIAGVIAMRPEVLILDEPTAGLDPKARRDILGMIETVHRTEGNIIILVSHNMDDIARLSDKILVMDEGRLAMSGTPAEVFAEEEKLKEIGLDIPGVTELARTLRGKGFDIDKDIFTVDRAEEEIARCLTKDHK